MKIFHNTKLMSINFIRWLKCEIKYLIKYWNNQEDEIEFADIPGSEVEVWSAWLPGRTYLYSEILQIQQSVSQIHEGIDQAASVERAFGGRQYAYAHVAIAYARWISTSHTIDAGTRWIAAKNIASKQIEHAALWLKLHSQGHRFQCSSQLTIRRIDSKIPNGKNAISWSANKRNNAK